VVYPFSRKALYIGKNVHEVGSFRSDTLEALHEPFSLYNSQTGFEQLASHLDRLLTTYPRVELGNEPTGIYYEAIGQHIQTRFESAITSGR
jgi:hypothetical protein